MSLQRDNLLFFPILGLGLPLIFLGVSLSTTQERSAE
jgi:hypothetical protein